MTRLEFRRLLWVFGSVVVLPIANVSFGKFEGSVTLIAAGAAIDGDLAFLAVALEERNFLVQF